jgi:hypothetical protein
MAHFILRHDPESASDVGVVADRWPGENVYPDDILQRLTLL